MGGREEALRNKNWRKLQLERVIKIRKMRIFVDGYRLMGMRILYKGRAEGRRNSNGANSKNEEK